MSITKEFYGKTAAGEDVYSYLIDNGKGVAAEFITYGGIVTKILVKDKNGEVRDVVLGRASLAEYENNLGYIGAAIGRHANRIAKGQFEINGETFNAAFITSETTKAVNDNDNDSKDVSVHATYDYWGNPLTKTDANGNVTSYSYDT
ncbi:MAG: hypothetical protein PUD92_05735, partial [Clostridiales bacterium]|nr:hypothetical protein [Clostridiales bacterium]